MNAPAEHTAIIPTVPGTPWNGLFYMGRCIVGLELRALFLPPKAVRYSPDLPWNGTKKSVKGATSHFDGRANTLAMAKAGSKLAQWALDLRVGPFDDFHLLAPQDALVIYGNLPDAGAAFKKGGDEAFEWEWIWLSAQHREHSDYAYVQDFVYGQYWDRKTDHYRGVAVRSVPIQ